MKKGLLFLLLLLIPFISLHAQTEEGVEENFSIMTATLSSLELAKGWALQDNGKWASQQNIIPNTNYKTNKRPTELEKLGSENFNSLELRKVTIKDKQYNVLIIRYNNGSYEFPYLREGWEPFESAEYFVFKARNLKKVLPQDIPFNKPYTVNLEVFCAGKVREYDYTQIEGIIVKKIQHTLNKLNVNGTNLVIAVEPVQKNGKESIKFKLIKTYSKRSFNSFWLDQKNANTFFEKTYWEAQLFRFKKFIRDADKHNVPETYMDVSDFHSYYNRGVLKYKSGNYEGAIEDFNAAVALKPDTAFSLIYSFRGIAKTKLKRFNEAIEDFDKALDIKPTKWSESTNWIKNYHNRGVARFYSNDLEGACEDWETAFGTHGFGSSLEYLERFCK